MRHLILALALAVPFSAAQAASVEPTLPAHPGRAAAPLTPGDGAAQLAYMPDERLYKSCRRKVRRAYGWGKGRHVLSLRLAYIQQCVAAGGRVV